MAQKIAPGGTLRFANSSGATIETGKAFPLSGGKLALPLADIPDGESGSVAIAGVYDVPKLATDAASIGAKWFWDATNKRCTTTASGNTYCGDGYSAAANGEATVQLILNGLPA